VELPTPLSSLLCSESVSFEVPNQRMHPTSLGVTGLQGGSLRSRHLQSQCQPRVMRVR
jgi:hypothetical protein